MPSWTAPKTWATGELVTAQDLNTHLRDNLEVLKDPPSAEHTLNQGGDYTTTSTIFVDVDATDLALTIATNGGAVMVGVSLSWLLSHSSQSFLYFNVAVDGTPHFSGDGVMVGQVSSAATTRHGHFAAVWLIDGLSAGSHTFKLQWKVQAGTATIFAGAGTADLDTQGQFWVREVS